MDKEEKKGETTGKLHCRGGDDEESDDRLKTDKRGKRKRRKTQTTRRRLGRVGRLKTT